MHVTDLNHARYLGRAALLAAAATYLIALLALLSATQTKHAQ